MGIDVLVCNLTRFGDLLQSQQVIDDLHQGGMSTGLICLENFAPAAALLKNVARTWSLPGASLLALLDKNWPAACAEMLGFVENVRKEANARHVLNLTPTVPARILSRLLAGRDGQIIGFGIDEAGFGHNNGVWASFLSVAASGRLNSPVNLSNILRRIALPVSRNLSGSFRLSEPDQAACAEADAFINTARVAGHAPKGFVAFQPGASKSSRQWPLESFIALGQRLWDEERICPVLLGSSDEAALGTAYASAASHPFLNAIGKTNLPMLAALLARTGFLVTNDTGTMHLAAGLGVPVLAFFMATAQPWDTGPLLPGCCCLEPAMGCQPCAFDKKCELDNACRVAISTGSAGDLALAWLRHGDWSRGFTERVARECRVWITATDDNGMACLTRLGDAQNDERSQWMSELRNFWCHLLDDLDIQAGLMPAGIRETARDARAPLSKMAVKAGLVLGQSAEILDTIAACGALALKSPHAGQLFLRNCERLQTMLDSCEATRSMGVFWREFRLNQGESLERFLPALPVLAANFRKFSRSPEELH